MANQPEEIEKKNVNIKIGDRDFTSDPQHLIAL